MGGGRVGGGIGRSRASGRTSGSCFTTRIIVARPRPGNEPSVSKAAPFAYFADWTGTSQLRRRLSGIASGFSGGGYFELALPYTAHLMETDSFFYQLLKQLPETLFALLGQPLERAAEYRFESVEIKKSYRFDGLFVPARTDLPFYSVEIQFQRAPGVLRQLVRQGLFVPGSQRSRSGLDGGADFCESSDRAERATGLRRLARITAREADLSQRIIRSGRSAAGIGDFATGNDRIGPKRVSWFRAYSAVPIKSQIVNEPRSSYD